MSSGTSHLEESGVWCADEESSDDIFVSKVSPPKSPKLSNGKPKHSGGSVDASGDVQIVDLKDFTEARRFCKSSSSNKFIRRNSKRKSFSKSSAVDDNVASRVQGIAKKRRSSSFSKIFSYNRKTAPPVFMRQTSFGIKRIPIKSRTVEIDDNDVLWPDSALFKVKESKLKDIKRNYDRNTSTATSDFTMKSGSTMLMELEMQPREARSEQASMAGTTTLTRSITSRPSVASSFFREPHYYLDNQKCSSQVTPEARNQVRYEPKPNDSLASTKKEVNDIEKMVEDLNVRNFLHSEDKSNFQKIGVRWLVKQLYCLYLTTAMFAVISLILLCLTIWLVHDSNNLRQSINEIKESVGRVGRGYYKNWPLEEQNTLSLDRSESVDSIKPSDIE